MNAYVDASALVKLVLDERESDDTAASWVEIDEPYASLVEYVELRAALAAAQRAGRQLRSGMTGTEAAMRETWEEVTPVYFDEAVARTAGALAERHQLRALDAIHLASALLVAGSDRFAFLSFDVRLRAAAAAEGFVVLPKAL